LKLYDHIAAHVIAFIKAKYFSIYINILAIMHR